MNIKDELRLELLQTDSDPNEFKKSVLVNIELKAEVQWKSDINCVYIGMYDRFNERGLPNSLNDIIKFENTPKS